MISRPSEFVNNDQYNICASDSNGVLTYQELSERSNCLAAFLKEIVQNEEVVAVLMERSTTMIEVIAGIWKAGACYLPIDPELPEKRILFMMENANVKTIISEKKYLEKVESLVCNCVKLSSFLCYDSESDSDCTDNEYPKSINRFYRNKLLNYSTDSINLATPSQLAYVIYTSGSTGLPKGVMVEHQGMLNHLHAKINDLKLDQKSVIAQNAASGFDISVWQMFAAAVVGGRTVIYSKELIQNPPAFINQVEQDKITILEVVPSYLNLLLDSVLPNHKLFNSLRYVLVTGETLHLNLVKRWFQRFPNIHLVNAYGPTEASDDITHYIMDSVPDCETISIGKALQNTRIYIVDEDMQPCAIGSKGEIYVSGIGVGRGYINNSHKTKAAFIENPFVDRPGERLYKTGDIGRFLWDGSIDLFGRKDDQIKIQGNRVELGEIEHALAQMEAITSAAVVEYSNILGEKTLNGFIKSSNKDLLPEDVLAELRQSLPAYMIPSEILVVDKLPLLSNGKVDRETLRKNKIAKTYCYKEPQNETEVQLVELWKEVLGVEKVSVSDSFFEIGGNSLKAIRLAAKLQSNFRTSVADILQYPTIEALAQKLTSEKDFLRNKLDSIIQQIKSHEINASQEHYRAQEKELTRNIFTQKKEYLNSFAALDSIDYSAKVKYNKVLLLGCTGFLGIHILYDILFKGTSSIIVIIRAQSDLLAVKRLNEKWEFYFQGDIMNFNSRLEIVSGDICETRFGLNDAQYNRLLNNVEVVVNAAANVKHYDAKENYLKSNIYPIKTLIDFCSNGIKKVLHHVSTISIIGRGNQKDLLFTESDLEKDQIVNDHYSRSKLDAERMLWSARDNGLLVNIYRVGNLTFHSQSGIFQYNIGENASYHLLKCFLALQCIPSEFEPFRLSNIDQVSEAIFTIFDKKELFNRNFHIQNPTAVSISDFVRCANRCGFPLHEVSIVNLFETILNNYRIEDDLINRLLLHLDIFDNNQPGEMVLVCSEQTDYILNKLNFKWLQNDHNSLSLMFNNNKSRVYFDTIEDM
jgi:amino acid adenylation domain-containing protein/thioester reductase-like protein